MADNRLGRFILHKRKQKGLTQQELGERIGYTKSSLCLIEKGHSIPRPDILKDIAEVLQVPYSRLMIEAGYINLNDFTDDVLIKEVNERGLAI